MERENAGFRIVAEIPIAKGTELVIGFKETSLGEQYVCWFCKDKTNYYWGDYSHTYRKVIYSLIKRLNDYFPGAPK